MTAALKEQPATTEATTLHVPAEHWWAVIEDGGRCAASERDANFHPAITCAHLVMEHGKGYVESTDRFVLCRKRFDFRAGHPDAEITGPPVDVLIPMQSLLRAKAIMPKVPRNAAPWLDITIESGSVTITCDHGTYVETRFPLMDTTFVDVQNLLDVAKSEPPGTMPPFAPDRLGKLSKPLRGRKSEPLRLVPHGELKAIEVLRPDDPDFTALLMPVRSRS